MFAIRILFKQYTNQLQEKYPKQEAEAMVYWLMDFFMGIKRKDILLDKIIPAIPPALERAVEKLLEGMPIQYITESAPFYGRDFKVNPSVLIPRNETEELVHLIIQENKNPGLKILDLGSGSGCISITLALELDNAMVSGVDISEEVLHLAEFNASVLGASVYFSKLDILLEDLPSTEWDILVSNPPYVRNSEKVYMHQNVLEYEPHLALFVTDEDPLLFYRIISQKGKSGLKSGGKIYFEINEALGQQVQELVENLGYIQIKSQKDMNNRDRIVSAVNP